MNNAKRLAALEEQMRPPASICDAFRLLLTREPWTDAERALVTECAKTSEHVRALLDGDERALLDTKDDSAQAKQKRS